MPSEGEPPGDPRGQVWTIVVAAGRGVRFGGPKQFEALGGRRVLDWALAAAASVSTGVVAVVPPERAAAGDGVAGGATRSDSVRRGLSEVPSDAAIVCVHDAARPFASPSLFRRVIAAVADGADGAVPGVPLSDTVKEVRPDGAVVATLDRTALRAVQTPQAFRAEALRTAHAAGGDGPDDAALVEAVGGWVVVVEGEAENRKLTDPADLTWARALVAGGAFGEAGR